MKTVSYPNTITEGTIQNDKLYPLVVEEISKAAGRKAKYCDREYWMFGYCQRWQFETGDPLYLIDNKLFTWEELKDWLRENWRPVRQDEVDWFCQNLTP